MKVLTRGAHPDLENGVGHMKVSYGKTMSGGRVGLGDGAESYV